MLDKIQIFMQISMSVFSKTNNNMIEIIKIKIIISLGSAMTRLCKIVYRCYQSFIMYKKL